MKEEILCLPFLWAAAFYEYFIVVHATHTLQLAEGNARAKRRRHIQLQQLQSGDVYVASNSCANRAPNNLSFFAACNGLRRGGGGGGSCQRAGRSGESERWSMLWIMMRIYAWHCRSVADSARATARQPDSRTAGQMDEWTNIYSTDCGIGASFMASTSTSLRPHQSTAAGDETRLCVPRQLHSAATARRSMIY